VLDQKVNNCIASCTSISTPRLSRSRELGGAEVTLCFPLLEQQASN